MLCVVGRITGGTGKGNKAMSDPSCAYNTYLKQRQLAHVLKQNQDAAAAQAAVEGGM